MLKAIIDATAYPVVRIESNNRIIPPSRAMRVLEFEPIFNLNPLLCCPNYLLYFKEDENEDEKVLRRYIGSFAECRTGTLQHSISGRIEGEPGTKGTT